MGAAWRATLPLRWAVGLGALSGFVAAGVGSRVVMKLIALADPSTEGTFTDAEATVGDFTVAGTLSLLVLGTIAGIMGGLVYLGVRRWLPVPPAWKGVAFGVLTLTTVGNVLIDAGNVDFQIFAPVLLVVALFSALFLVNGLLLAELMARYHPEPAYAHRPWASRAAAGVIVIVCVVGIIGFVGGTLGMIEDQGTCLRAAGGGNGCAVLADRDPGPGGRAAGSGGS